MNGPRVFQIVGFKNAGKTTLICRLVGYFAAAGLRVGTIKHDGHDFEPDVPGTDSWRHRQAGSVFSAVVSATATSVVRQAARSLDELIREGSGCDLLLVEGFKDAAFDKLALLRAPEDIPALAGLGRVCALALGPELLPKRDRLGLPADVPAYGRDEIEAIAGRIADVLGIEPGLMFASRNA